MPIIETRFIDPRELGKNIHVHDAVDIQLQVKNLNGKKYELLGQMDEKLSIVQRIWSGMKALAKSIFSVVTLGLVLRPADTVKDWSLFWNGKKTEILYTSEPFLARKILADNGDAHFKFLLGRMYMFGDSVQQDHQMAFGLFLEAAKMGDVGGQRAVGECYYYGDGVIQDYSAARAYLQLADNNSQGDFSQVVGQSQLLLGTMFQNGLGGAKDERQAAEWYNRVAAYRFPIASYNVGNLYREGKGVKQSYASALSAYQRAADMGYGPAMKALGDMYYNGLGVEKNVQKANEFFERAKQASDLTVNFNPLNHP